MFSSLDKLYADSVDYITSAVEGVLKIEIVNENAPIECLDTIEISVVSPPTCLSIPDTIDSSSQGVFLSANNYNSTWELSSSTSDLEFSKDGISYNNMVPFLEERVYYRTEILERSIGVQLRNTSDVSLCNTVSSLFINKPCENSLDTVHLEGCDSVVVGSITYFNSNEFREELISQEGCDSITNYSIRVIRREVGHFGTIRGDVRSKAYGCVILNPLFEIDDSAIFAAIIDTCA